jgi:hypothetical protein
VRGLAQGAPVRCRRRELAKLRKEYRDEIARIESKDIDTNQPNWAVKLDLELEIEQEREAYKEWRKYAKITIADEIMYDGG